MGTKQEAFVLPVGTVTLLLGDVEGSVRLWEADREAARSASSTFTDVVSDAVGRHAGVRPVEQGEGDSFVAAFARPSDALRCALDIQLALADGPLRPRLGLHTGEVQLRDEGNYIGETINRCARLRDTAHGGQTVLSRTAHDLVVDRLPDGVTLRELGAHRLRDLSRPEQVFQLCHPGLVDVFPPLRSLDVLPNNLPVQLTSFIGREREVAAVKELLARSRLVTLTGAGGCGKTRLALQACADLMEVYPDGVWWVDLASLADPALVPNAVAVSLLIKEVPGQPFIETLKHRLQQQRMLLLLDNCEHVVDACAVLVDTLLHACPALGILATSREPLRVEGEAPWRVPSMTVPDEKVTPAIESLSQYEAVRLFVERALRARPNFRVTNDNAAAVAGICQRLDGIPLAIELASARVRMLSPEQILDGLDDRFHLLTGGMRTAFPRQQTLEASVDWSHELLGDDERALLRRLSVFAGGFTLDAAEHACSGDGIDRYRILDLLSQLTDRSLVHIEEAAAEVRYRLLETIRQYARNRLSASGEEDDVRTRHLDFYTALAERGEQEMQGEDVLLWVERFDFEHDNLRAAMDWAVASGRTDTALRLTASLGFFWGFRGHYTEGRAGVEAVLALPDADPELRAKALAMAAQVIMMAGDIPAARDVGEEAVAIARQIGDRKTLGRALDSLGWVTGFIDPPSAPALFEESIALCRESGDAWWLADALLGVAHALFWRGDVSGAAGMADEVLTHANKSHSELALVFLGWAASVRGDITEARRSLEEAIAIGRELRELTAMGFALSLLGMVEIYQGRYDQARDHLDEALALRQESPMAATFILLHHGRLEYAAGRLGDAAGALDEALGLSRAMELAQAISLTLLFSADVALQRRDLAAARAYLDDAMAVARKHDMTTGGATRGLGRLARAEGDDERAESLHHEALTTFFGSGAKLDIVDSLESLAGIAAAQESFREAARLFGAAEALRERLGYVRLPVEQGAYEADVTVAREGLSTEELDAAWAEGRAMSLEDAVAYASRGRGERKRPSAGWSSLTPTENEVVRLVAQGLSNPQIAERLFVSRNTVKTHLAQVFAKLGVSSRAELATEATRRKTTDEEL